MESHPITSFLDTQWLEQHGWKEYSFQAPGMGSYSRGQQLLVLNYIDHEPCEAVFRRLDINLELRPPRRIVPRSECESLIDFIKREAA